MSYRDLEMIARLFRWDAGAADEILLRLEKGGKGHVVISPGGNIEHVYNNGVSNQVISGALPKSFATCTRHSTL